VSAGSNSEKNRGVRGLPGPDWLYWKVVDAHIFSYQYFWPDGRFAEFTLQTISSDRLDLLERKSMLGKIVLIIGILGVLLGGAVLLISLLLPVLTDGRTSWDEALLGIIPGAIVLTISFLIFAGGLIIVLVQRKKKQVTA
jgi:hypothetical protein